MSTKQQKPSTQNLESQTSTDIKYKVIPNLSLRGSEIMSRLSNRTLILSDKGKVYGTEDIDFDKFKTMNRTEIARQALKNQQTIIKSRKQLEDHARQPQPTN